MTMEQNVQQTSDAKKQIKEYLLACREKYVKDLTDNILPFWLEHGWDRENGGVYTCLDREGWLMDSTKSVWFQGRCAFIYAFAYNNIEKRPEYLEFAKSCIDFSDAHCYDAQGRMYFEVAADGTPLRMRRYVFSECFACIALAEYAIATGDKAYAHRALDLYQRIVYFLNTPGILQPKYEPSVQARGHSITMILINTAARVREACGDQPELEEQISRSLSEIKRYFMHPEFKCVLEMVGPEGELIDTLAGRVINPGHCIETSWFILEEARHRGWDKDITDMALTILDWSWKWGWDEEFGGIINFRDCRNFPAQDYSQDMKFWWPQTEAVIAALYAYLATGDERYIELHRQANDWMYSHLPDTEFPEWFGYLHRDGTVAQTAKGNIFKGPFHIPRMLIKSTLLIDEILKKI